MKYNGLRIDYENLSKNSQLSIHDIFTLSKLIADNNIGSSNKSLQKKSNRINTFYELLGDSILRGIGSIYNMDNYNSVRFKKDIFIFYSEELSYRGLIKIRNSYLDVIHIFANQYIGSPWKNIEKMRCFEMAQKEVSFYYSHIKKLEEHIINISNLIGTDLGEDVEKYISFGDLQAYYGFDLDMNEIQEKYFRL